MEMREQCEQLQTSPQIKHGGSPVLARLLHRSTSLPTSRSRSPNLQGRIFSRVKPLGKDCSGASTARGHIGDSVVRSYFAQLSSTFN
eukprot:1094349-Prorocentrum_minimum.AAC.1